MSQPARRKVADQVLIQLIEADVDIGFALVDEARAFHAFGQPQLSLRVLQEATDILADIEQRLQQLNATESMSFAPLVAELRNEITAAERENRGRT